MDATKIRLSTEEKELLLRPDWILTKNSIQKKVWQLLEHLQAAQQPAMKMLPEEVRVISGKISRGENYKGLPWLILDQPRYFDKDNVFAIRTLFWWGHFFSCTLQLSGRYKEMYEQKIVSGLSLLKEKDFFICVNTDPWEHHFEEENYIAANNLSDTTFKEIVNKNSFIKLSKKISLEDWDKAEDLLLDIFLSYMKMLS
jgi:hypothetical protein